MSLPVLLIVVAVPVVVAVVAMLIWAIMKGRRPNRAVHLGPSNTDLAASLETRVAAHGTQRAV